MLANTVKQTTAVSRHWNVFHIFSRKKLFQKKMGRLAYFSTGFEYKFAFALQESSDMREFGGQNRNHH
jgi:hypothetical protein